MVLHADEAFAQPRETCRVEGGSHRRTKAAHIFLMGADYPVGWAFQRVHIGQAVVQAGQFDAQRFAHFGGREQAIDLGPEDLGDDRLPEQEIAETEDVLLEGIVDFRRRGGLGQLQDEQGGLAIHFTNLRQMTAGIRKHRPGNSRSFVGVGHGWLGGTGWSEVTFGMLMQTSNVMLISLSLSLILLTSCANETAAGNAPRKVDPTAALTAQVKQAAASESASTTADMPSESSDAGQQVSGGGQENPLYTDGITDQNRGDKVGKVKFSGSIPNKTGMLYLFETEGRNVAPIDSAQLVNGQFDFGQVEVGRGFYGLGFESGKKTGDIIMNPDEPVLTINFQNARLVGGGTDSRENQGWFAYRGAEGANKNKIRQLYKNGKGKEEETKRLVKEKEDELAGIQRKFIQDYPGTYLAKFLTWKQPRFIGDKGVFLSDLDVSDNSLIRSMALPDRIQSMMRTFSGGKDAGFLSCIDLVKAACEDNPVVLEFALYNMLDGFYNTGKETICQYILDNYIFDEDCGANLSDVIRQRAQGIINLRVGNTPPNFRIADPSGMMVDLGAEVAKHEYTLVMFWASWCHKCEQEIPNLVPMYKDYNPRGFQVVGVSVDQQKMAWTKAIADNQIPWPNVSQLKGWDAPITDDYKITQTPTYFLLDKEGKIVLKPERWFEVQRFLQARI